MPNPLAMVSSAPLLVPGMKLGKYQLIRRLAVGGMAEIYLAKATGIEGFEKLVVLKRILPQHAATEEFIAMFLNEAKLAATLHHPNIAQTYDIGSDGGSFFFTMEFVHGEDMRQILKAAEKMGKQMRLEHAVNVVLGVCAGLHHAHEKLGNDGRPLGIVHRDVSPSNVIVSHDGMVKLVDFGIAKATTHRAETRVGTLKGKIAYMSPEQCRGERLDRRADLFAIGILLYEFTTGQRLFQGDNEFAILNFIVNDDVKPPSVHVPGYPPELERIVLKALRRNRDQRYASAQEMQMDLEAFARSERLMVSSVSLARFMEELFGKRMDPWLEITRRGATGQTPVLDMLDLPLPAPDNTGRFEGEGGPPQTMPGYVPPLSGPEPGAPLEQSVVAGESAKLQAALRPKRRWGWLAAAGALAVVAVAVLAIAFTHGDTRQAPAAEAASARQVPAEPAPPTHTPPPAPTPTPTPPPPAPAAVSTPEGTPAVSAPVPEPPVETPIDAVAAKPPEKKHVTPPRSPVVRQQVRTQLKPANSSHGEKSDKPDKAPEPDKPKEWDPDSPLPPPGH